MTFQSFCLVARVLGPEFVSPLWLVLPDLEEQRPLGILVSDEEGRRPMCNMQSYLTFFKCFKKLPKHVKHLRTILVFVVSCPSSGLIEWIHVKFALIARMS